jgi:hypothetical protein
MNSPITDADKRHIELSKMVHKQMVFNETVRAETRHYDKNRSTDSYFNPRTGKPPFLPFNSNNCV